MDRHFNVRMLVVVFLLGILTSIPAFAGSAVVGAVVGGKNATLSGQQLIAGHTIFSGDNLQVEDGAAVVTMGKGSRLVFGHDTVVSFDRESSGVTALLQRGDVSVYHPMDDSLPLRLKIANLSIVPAEGFKTLGEVAITGQNVIIKTSEGLLRVEGAGQMYQVPKGKVIKFTPKASRAPQTTGGAQKYGGDADVLLDVAAVGAGAVAAILAGVAMSRAGDAKTQATAATAAANQADADAKAAQAAANNANDNALAVGCTLNKLFGTLPSASQFVPANGSC